MNARKDRYAIRISETTCAEMQQEALQDGAKEMAAVFLVALEKASGWRTVRLKRILDTVQELLLMPSAFGNDITAEDAIKHIRQEYGIDVDALEIPVDIEYRRGGGQK